MSNECLARILTQVDTIALCTERPTPIYYSCLIKKNRAILEKAARLNNPYPMKNLSPQLR